MIEALTIYLTVAAAFAVTAWAKERRNGIRFMTVGPLVLFGLIWPVVLIAAFVMLLWPEED